MRDYPFKMAGEEHSNEYGYGEELNKVFNDVNTEIEDAQQKWGSAFDKKNTANDWIAYIAGYVGAAVTVKWDKTTFRKMLVKAAGLCMSAILWCDITNGDMPKRHYD